MTLKKNIHNKSIDLQQIGKEKKYMKTSPLPDSLFAKHWAVSQL
jgi:hypothetical protein